jgi:hypothetical protein
MQDYPLFTLLEKKVKENNSKEIDINKLCTTINNITDSKHYEEILALIYYYEKLDHNGNTLSKLPYDSKMITKDKGIIINIKSLPTTLLYIIAEYIQYYKTPC